MQGYGSKFATACIPAQPRALLRFSSHSVSSS